MPNTVTLQVLEEGTKNTTVNAFLQADGIEGDQTYVLASPPAGKRFRLLKIDHNLSGFEAKIGFDSGLPDNNYVWAITGAANNSVSWKHTGGPKDNSGLDGTGDLILTTVGFTDAADVGAVCIRAILIDA